MLATIIDKPPKPYKGFYHSHIFVEETKAQWLRNLSRATQPGTREPEFHSFHEGQTETVQLAFLSPKWESVSLISKALCASSTGLFTI
jgi:hypothetical protein